jgi:hypothetical protein
VQASAPSLESLLGVWKGHESYDKLKKFLPSDTRAVQEGFPEFQGEF